MISADIIIVGGGYSGLSLALMLAKNNFKSVLVERSELISSSKSTQKPCKLFALAAATCDLYKKYDIVLPFAEMGQSINYIRTLDHGSTVVLDFCPQELGMESFGYMVEERILQQQLIYQVKQQQNIQLITKQSIKDISYNGENICVTCSEGVIAGKILVGADGKNSRVRQVAGIESFKHDYRQIGIVCDIKHEKSHAGVAVERFMPEGPFAILPKKGGFHSSIVWTDSAGKAPMLRTLTATEMQNVIQKRFGDHLGEIALASSVEIFPLELCHAHKYYAEKIALVGDAAHAIHPVAGQGFNLGLRDADLLATLLLKQRQLGLELASPLMLKAYENTRKKDNNLLIEATHFINSIFASQLLPVKTARRLGISVINELSWLKKPIMAYASGYTAC